MEREREADPNGEAFPGQECALRSKAVPAWGRRGEETPSLAARNPQRENLEGLKGDEGAICRFHENQPLSFPAFSAEFILGFSLILPLL